MGHAACMGNGVMFKDFGWGNLREEDNLEDPDLDGRIILR